MFWKRRNAGGRKRGEPVSSPAGSASSDLTQTELHQRVARVIAGMRPLIQADGGDIELVGVSGDGVVRVRLHGACVGCPAASMTLQMGLERQLREQISQVRAVENVG